MDEEKQTVTKDLVQNQKEPMRLNKYLSDAGFCSRREGDRLTEEGRVTIDGHAAVLGEKVLPGQEVCVDGVPVYLENKLILLAFHKPEGIECTSDRTNPDNLIDYIKYPERIYPIGRLDKQSTGLLLLTNTGGLVNQILKSSNYHEKEYQVTVEKDVTPQFLSVMSKGVTITIENENRTVTTRKCKVKKRGKRSFSIVLTQGYNRQIRRMCRALDYHVRKLKRVRVMNILLGDLPVGAYREVQKDELDELLRLLHL